MAKTFLLWLLSLLSTVSAVAGADPGVEGLFPGGISPYLARFEESALGTWAPANDPHQLLYSGPRYRITRLAPGSLLCLKVFTTTGTSTREKVAERQRHLVLKEGAFDKPDTKGTRFLLSEHEYSRLMDTFWAQEIFSLPPRIESVDVLRGVMGGEVWVFERWTPSSYRGVARQQPNVGPARVSADFLLDLRKRIRAPE